MNRNNLALSLVLAVLVVGVYYYDSVIVYERKKQQSLEKQLVPFANKEVKAFSLSRDNGEKFRCKRVGLNEWTLTEPLKGAADTEMVESILNAIGDARIDRVLAASAPAEEWAGYGFNKPRYKIWLDLGDRQVTVLLGNNTPTKKLYYAALGGDPRVLLVSYDVSHALNKDLFTMRDKGIITLKTKAVDRITLTYPDRQLVLERDGATEWVLTAPEKKKIDRYEVEAFIRKLDYMETKKFLDTVDQKQAGWEKEYGFDKPALTIEVVSAPDKTVQTIIVGKKEVGGRLFYTQRPQQQTLYALDSFSYNDLQKHAFDFEKKYIFAMDRSRVKRIEIRKPTGTVILKREGEGDNWTIIRPKLAKADTRKVADFLGNMTASVIKAFVFTVDDEVAGFSKPKAEIYLSLEGEKEPRLFTVGKAKNSTFGFGKTKDKTFLIDLKTAQIFLENLEDKPNL